MIEMQWVKIEFGNIKKEMVQLQKSINVGGVPHVLQFREVKEHAEDGSVKVATEWQDVKIGEST